MAIQKQNEFKELTIQYQSNGNSTLEFFTDFPGAALAVRKTVTIPTSSNARATYTLPLDGLEGTEFYFKFTPGATTQLRLFSGSLKLRLIGIYLDGSISEIWQTTPIALGA